MSKVERPVARQLSGRTRLAVMRIGSGPLLETFMSALVILVVSIGWYSLAAGAVLGGIGFGFFIDEVGKFVTSDNNYFFRPAVSIMYVVFVLFFVTVQPPRKNQASKGTGSPRMPALSTSVR